MSRCTTLGETPAASASVAVSHRREWKSNIAVVADVQGLMKVAYQVDDEPQGDAALLDRPGRVPEDVEELSQLVHDASLPGVRSGEPRVVSGLIERNVHVVPGSAPLDVAAVLIGPGRGIGHRRVDRPGPGQHRARGQRGRGSARTSGHRGTRAATDANTSVEVARRGPQQKITPALQPGLSARMARRRGGRGRAIWQSVFITYAARRRRYIPYELFVMVMAVNPKPPCSSCIIWRPS